MLVSKDLFEPVALKIHTVTRKKTQSRKYGIKFAFEIPKTSKV